MQATQRNPRMRVVCDTNVLVSAILFGGKPRDILRLCSSGKVTNFTSPALLNKIAAVLQRPKYVIGEEHVYGIIRLFRDTFSIVRQEIYISILTTIPPITVFSKPPAPQTQKQ